MDRAATIIALAISVAGCLLPVTRGASGAEDPASPSRTRELRLLWIGNYLPAMGGVPRSTELLLERADPKVEVLTRYVMDLHGSTTSLWEHQKGVDLIQGTATAPPAEPKKKGRNDRAVLERFVKAKPDWVVLQVGLSPGKRGGAPADLAAIRGYRDLCREAGVKLLLFETGMGVMGRTGAALEAGEDPVAVFADRKHQALVAAIPQQAGELGLPCVSGAVAYTGFVTRHPTFVLQRRKDNHYTQEVGYFMACLTAAALGGGPVAEPPDAEVLFGAYNEEQQKKFDEAKKKAEAKGQQPKQTTVHLAAFQEGEQAAIHAFAWPAETAR